MTLTVHLKLHNEADYDRAIDALYTPGSPTYHHWFTAADFATYAPSPGEVEIVKHELQAFGFSILSVSADNASLRVRGAVSSVESAFNTLIHVYERDGKAFHANATPAKLAGIAADLVDSVSGLSDFGMRPQYVLQSNPKTGKATRISAAQVAVSGLEQLVTNACFQSPTSVYLTTTGFPEPVATYVGNVYDQDPLKPYAPCAWTPKQLQEYYGVQVAIKDGLNGKGQTIVIVGGPSDPSVKTDLVTFSQATGLPAITSSNFEIIYPDGKPTQLYLDNVANWDTEAELDIEWAHAIAPGAKIILLITPTQDWSEFEYAIQYAVEHKIGSVISNSYGYPELAWGAFTVSGFEAVLKRAAAAGVAVNFSSGDSGDYGLGSPNAGGDLYPAASAYVTSVGGTSIGVPNQSGGVSDVGWGNNLTSLSEDQDGFDQIFDPPFSGVYYGGSGGGKSRFIAKPFWQKSLPGTRRQQPDIAAVADPYTGAIVFLSSPGPLGLLPDWYVVGGTSLATPVFSALWTLADQKAGVALGQAAPLIAKLPPGAVTDVVPVGSDTNVAGIVEDNNGATYYSSDRLIQPFFSGLTYFSALWNQGGAGYLDISFGTDSSLTVTTGWDNVTGWGVPNGEQFIHEAAALR